MNHGFPYTSTSGFLGLPIERSTAESLHDKATAEKPVKRFAIAGMRLSLWYGDSNLFISRFCQTELQSFGLTISACRIV